MLERFIFRCQSWLRSTATRSRSSWWSRPQLQLPGIMMIEWPGSPWRSQYGTRKDSDGFQADSERWTSSAGGLLVSHRDVTCNHDSSSTTKWPSLQRIRGYHYDRAAGRRRARTVVIVAVDSDVVARPYADNVTTTVTVKVVASVWQWLSITASSSPVIIIIIRHPPPVTLLPQRHRLTPSQLSSHRIGVLLSWEDYTGQGSALRLSGFELEAWVTLAEFGELGNT